MPSATIGDRRPIMTFVICDGGEAKGHEVAFRQDEIIGVGRAIAAAQHMGQRYGGGESGLPPWARLCSVSVPSKLFNPFLHIAAAPSRLNERVLG